MVDVFAFQGSKKPFNYLRAWLQVQKNSDETPMIWYMLSGVKVLC